MENKIVLINRTSISIGGIEKVVAISDNLISLEVDGSNLQVSGSNIQVEKLSVENGTLDAIGEFDCVKFSSQKQKGGFFKRIFK